MLIAADAVDAMFAVGDLVRCIETAVPNFGDRALVASILVRDGTYQITAVNSAIDFGEMAGINIHDCVGCPNRHEIAARMLTGTRQINATH